MSTDMAGYSGTGLAVKLGIKAGMRIATPGAPDHLDALLVPLPNAVTWKRAVRPPLDLAVAFYRWRREVPARLAGLQRVLGPEGVLWMAWPKRASGVPTDLTEDTFRELVLPTGWVDTKVCAIDGTWSGLKFVLRRDLRR